MFPNKCFILDCTASIFFYSHVIFITSTQQVKRFALGKISKDCNFQNMRYLLVSKLNQAPHVKLVHSSDLSVTQHTSVQALFKT